MKKKTTLGRGLLTLALSLTVGNFVYQLLPFLGQQDWRIAGERSFFQALALLLAWLLLRRDEK